LTATDDRGATATASAVVAIAPAAGRPTITASSVTGALQAGQPGTITVSCTAIDTEGTVESVVADLSQLGGPAVQALTANAEQWIWTGTVTPSTNGPKAVTFTATNDQNRIGTSVATIYVAGSQPGSITGTWHGTMNYVFFFIDPDTEQIVGTWQKSKASTIDFGDTYQPDAFLVFWGDPSLLEIPAANLVNPGDTAVFDLQAIGDPPAHMVTVNAAVEDVTRSATAYSVRLSLQIDIHDGQPPILCTYHWEAALNANDQIVWTESSEFLFSGLHMTDATGTGLLSRQ